MADKKHTGLLAWQYAECFALILSLRVRHDFGDAGSLRERIKAMLRKARREAEHGRVPPQEIQMAEFAVVAFFDEAISLSDWSGAEDWDGNPLLFDLVLYTNNDSGEEFFRKLTSLRTHPSDNAAVLEVYYLCLALGYKGEYLLDDDPAAHQQLVKGTYDDLKRPLGWGGRWLSPHPKPKVQIISSVPIIPAWAPILFFIALSVFGYAFLNLQVGEAASDTARVLEAILRTL